LLPSLGIEVNGKMFRYASLVDYVRELAACDLIEPFHVCTKQDDVGIELVLAWARRGNVRCFVNCAPCGGGVQVTAMQAALTTVLGSRIPVRSERLKRRIFALVHVSLRHPKWGNPTHEWLTNTEVGDAVRDVVERELARHFDENPALLDQMLIDLQRRTRPGRSAPSPKRSARKRSRTPRARANAGSAAR
jgi:DNA gyrase/topoisomerase IV subunit B